MLLKLTTWKKWMTVPVLLLLLSTVILAKLKPGAERPELFQPPLAKATLETPAGVMVSWIGAGYLTSYTISNTGQSGVFEAPPGWGGYNGMWPTGYGLFNGRTGEFPRGTNHFYVWLLLQEAPGSITK